MSKLRCVGFSRSTTGTRRPNGRQPETSSPRASHAVLHTHSVTGTSEAPPRGRHRYAPELAVVVASILYGSTFRIVQDALVHVTASGFNTLRFAIGSAILLPFAWGRGWKGPAPHASDTRVTFLRAGVVLGVIATGAYLTQNLGLQHTSSSDSAFITGLFAVFTPLIDSVVNRRVPRPGIAVAVVGSVFGLYLLTGARLTLGFGDGITLVTAFLFGCWFVAIGAYASRFDVVALTAVHLGAIAVLSAPGIAVEGFGHLTGQAAFAIAFTAVGCSAVAFTLSTWAQRVLEPTRAGIFNLLEPVVAGIVGYAVGERLGVPGVVGALLILGGILIAERDLPAGPP